MTSNSEVGRRDANMDGAAASAGRRCWASPRRRPFIRSMRAWRDLAGVLP